MDPGTCHQHPGRFDYGYELLWVVWRELGGHAFQAMSAKLGIVTGATLRNSAGNSFRAMVIDVETASRNSPRCRDSSAVAVWGLPHAITSGRGNCPAEFRKVRPVTMPKLADIAEIAWPPARRQYDPQQLVACSNGLDVVAKFARIHITTEAMWRARQRAESAQSFRRPSSASRAASSSEASWRCWDKVSRRHIQVAT